LKPQHEAKIHKILHSKASHRLSETFREARKASQCPYWLGDDVWNNLLTHWNSPTYRNKCVIAQRNQGSEKGGSLHTGGKNIHS